MKWYVVVCCATDGRDDWSLPYCPDNTLYPDEPIFEVKEVAVAQALMWARADAWPRVLYKIIEISEEEV